MAISEGTRSIPGPAPRKEPAEIAQPLATVFLYYLVVKKSSAVPATFCAAVASLILQGCSSPVSVRRCVDPATGTILPDNACASPVTAVAYRGGQYARVQTDNGSVCIDTRTNQPVSDSFCRSTTGYYPGYYHMGRYYPRMSWGYDGNVSNGRVMNFSSSPKDGADVKSSSGSVISRGTSRGGFGSSSSSSGGFFS